MRTLLKILLWTLGVLGAIGGIVYGLLFDVWTIPSDDPVLTASIEPQLAPGDLVFISRSTDPDVGVLVRCIDPDAPARFVIGRIVGRGGDVLEISGGTFTLNGHGVSAPNACDPARVTVKNPATQEDEEVPCSNEEFAGVTHPALRAGIETHKHVEVEGSHVYLLSDNRMMHLDSRDFGSVPQHTCQRISFRLWGAAGYNDSKHRLSVVW